MVYGKDFNVADIASLKVYSKDGNYGTGGIDALEVFLKNGKKITILDTDKEEKRKQIFMILPEFFGKHGINPSDPSTYYGKFSIGKSISVASKDDLTEARAAGYFPLSSGVKKEKKHSGIKRLTIYAIVMTILVQASSIIHFKFYPGAKPKATKEESLDNGKVPTNFDAVKEETKENTPKITPKPTATPAPVNTAPPDYGIPTQKIISDNEVCTVYDVTKEVYSNGKLIGQTERHARLKYVPDSVFLKRSNLNAEYGIIAMFSKCNDEIGDFMRGGPLTGQPWILELDGAYPNDNNREALQNCISCYNSIIEAAYSNQDKNAVRGMIGDFFATYYSGGTHEDYRPSTRYFVNGMATQIAMLCPNNEVYSTPLGDLTGEQIINDLDDEYVMNIKDAVDAVNGTSK